MDFRPDSVGTFVAAPYIINVGTGKRVEINLVMTKRGCLAEERPGTLRVSGLSVFE